MIKRNIDSLGRIVIPKEMRKEIGVENGDEVDISLNEKKIIISNPKNFDIKKYIKNIQLDEKTSTETYRVLEDILNKL